jgi:hypothetical protein
MNYALLFYTEDEDEIIPEWIVKSESEVTQEDYELFVNEMINDIGISEDLIASWEISTLDDKQIIDYYINEMKKDDECESLQEFIYGEDNES